MNSSRLKKINSYRIGVDIGGTFTDAILINSNTGEIFTSKVLTTPSDPSIGFISAVEKILKLKKIQPEFLEYVVHATTVATNAIIEGKIAKTAFITTEGFRDMLEIARQIRPSLYDLQFKKPKPLIPRQLCFEVTERMNSKGEIIKPIDKKSMDKIIDLLIENKVDAVAICLLHSYRNPEHEIQLKRAIQQRIPKLMISTSSEVVPEFREYLRASTTVIDSSISPIINKYITSISKKLSKYKINAELLVMQSNGGVYTADAAIASPVHMVESGPAAGVVASSVLGKSLGYENIISFDMGGTTAKAALIRDGKPSVTKDYSVGNFAQTGTGAFGGSSGYPIRTPVIDLVEIGAGGGSIAWIDSGGALRVGPQSSGADPGPACYGLGGTQPTITDANLILGKLDPNYFADGEIVLDIDLAEKSIFDNCAKQLGLSVLEVANAIVEIANNAMVNALRLVSVQKGHDPREFIMVGFGGAGPAHVANLAEEVGIQKVLIPKGPGTASALGLLVTDVRMDLSKTLMVRTDTMDLSEIKEGFDLLEVEGKRLHSYKDKAKQKPNIFFERFLEMRYWGQSFELSIEAPDKIIDQNWLTELLESFHLAHESSYGFRVDKDPVEIVNLRLTAVRKISIPKTEKLKNNNKKRSTVIKGERTVYFSDEHKKITTKIYDRSKFSSGLLFSGPAIIEEPDSTSIIPPNWQVEVDLYGNLILQKK